LEDNLIARLQI